MKKTMTVGDDRRLEDRLFTGHGEMAELMRTTDWSKTGLGPVKDWPSALRTMLGVVLGSRFPMLLWWGPDLLELYNDAYRPILRDKHPASLGAPAREVWAEVWDVAGPMAQGVLEGGPATWTEDLKLFIKSGGMVEETYFTFSYSPVPGDEGGVGGVLNTVQETTAKVQSEREIRMLHDLAARAAEARSEEEAFNIASAVLSTNESDLPFVVLFRLDEGSMEAHLVGASGWMGYEGPAKPARAPVSGPSKRDEWPLAECLRTGREVWVDDLARRFGTLPVDGFNTSPGGAVVLPLTRPGRTEPYAFLVAGISPHRKFDDRYRGFFRATADQVMTVIANARAHESEKKRAEALAETDKVKTEFFANVSHELRTPLTLILSPVETLLSSPAVDDPLSRRELLRTVHNNAIRLLQMVNSLLDFSKLTAHKTRAKREPLDISDLTRSLFGDFAGVFARKPVEGVIVIDVPHPMVEMDRYLYERILFNLLSNAFKFTPAGGKITLEVRQEAEELRISVGDTGIGIPAADAKDLFKRFGQVEGSSTRRYEGTGLGLSLVKEFAALLDGSVSVESEPGKGSLFKVAFRAARVDGREAEHGERPSTRLVPRYGSTAAVPPPSPENEDATLPKLLIAEDNPELAAFIAASLSALCRIRVAGDGGEAISLVRSWKPDMVLSDVMMPKKDGLQLTREIKSDKGTAEIPVVLLTAMTGRDDLLNGWEAGADDYLFKPFHPKELEARIRSLLSMVQWRRKSERERKQRESLEEFANIASHDLKEPLRKITTYAQRLEKRLVGRVSAEEIGWLQSVLTGATRMYGLIESLIQYSRLDLTEEKAQETETGEVLDNAMVFHSLNIMESRARIVREDMPRLKVVPSLIEVVFRNLIGNSIKYRHSGRNLEIRVSASRQDHEWVISVEDNGIGFDPAYAESIFIMFKRLQGREKYPGDGMGLSICRKIVERHGGRIWAESVPDKGSVFRFTIPEK